MREWTRREVLKSGLAVAGAFAVAPEVARALARDDAGDGPVADPPAPDRSGALTAPARERLLLDYGWRFHLGHANDPGQDFGFGQARVFDKAGRLFAPSRANFDDSGWRAVDLPHDWAVELPFENAPELDDFGYKPLGRNYPATSIGWYRRTLDIPASDAGRRLALDFDGVFRDAMVVLNGHLLGRNFSGYAPFRLDITDIVNVGARNVLVVRVDATEREGWFYEGAGIYRHVWLVKTNPVHVAHWGTAVTSEINGTEATVSIVAEIENESDKEVVCRVVQGVYGGSGTLIGSARTANVHVAAWGRAGVRQSVRIAKPTLWSVGSPVLHQAVTLVDVGGTEVDRYETPFGIRTIHFDADRGFLLNGERLELKGTCNHQDHAGVGTALPDRLQYYRIEKLKAMGSNAYRTAHNPPTPELLDACDRLGMLVLDETRFFSSSDEGLSQLERMVRRDRNHPCVIAWSIANEEWTDQGTERGTRIASTLRRLARQLDPSRPVTAAMDSSYGKGVSLTVDVQGFNYQREDIDGFHRDFPRQPSMGTETASSYWTRGVYSDDKERGYKSAYDVNKPDYGATAEQWWTFYASRPFLAGGFVWTGFDYRGEPSPYRWPCINSHFGIMDTCGFPKDSYYYYQAWWGDKPVLHVFPHWNWAGREGQDIDVWVHSNLDRVELYLNGTSLGAKDMRRNSHLSWKVPYAPGTLEARGFRLGQVVLTARRETTGEPAGILLVPDRSHISADGEDVAVVDAYVVDGDGRVVPTAESDLLFRLDGPGRLIGVGNGDPSSHESDKGDTRRAFNGSCVAIVQATRVQGELRVEAMSPGFAAPARVVIPCVAATPRPAA